MYLLQRKIRYKKVLLWSIFAVQLILISIVVLSFGLLSNDVLLEQEKNVKFVKHFSENPFTSDYVWNKTNGKLKTQNNGELFKEFINSSLTGDSLCFRDGINVIKSKNSSCDCKFDYHGKDCGQPEVIWRAFMISKIPLNLSSPRREPHKIIYFIRSTFISMDTLQIQIMELENIVDFFILCDQHYSNKMMKDQSFKLNIRTDFLNQLKEKLIILRDEKCTLKSVYQKFRSTTGIEKGITADDVILFSNNDEILNWRAVKYFKWYDSWPQPVRFRLKYTVYGYFWKHPQSTILGSGACQVSILDEIFKSDPDRMMATKKPGMIVGDLNYIGGWFCQYCYHPLDVIKKMLYEKKNFFLEYKPVIDSKHIENLIGNGLFVDGKMRLTRLHRFSGKDYAPDYVSTNLSWRYQHILTNVYATYDDYDNE